MKWEISYRIIGDNNIRKTIKELHFTEKHEVGKWFKLNKNGFSGKRNVEFINAKVI